MNKGHQQLAREKDHGGKKRDEGDIKSGTGKSRSATRNEQEEEEGGKPWGLAKRGLIN